MTFRRFWGGIETMRRRNSMMKDERESGGAADCALCIRRKGCENAQEGSYCTKYQSREPEPEGEDPNKKWLTGQEYEDG